MVSFRSLVSFALFLSSSEAFSPLMTPSSSAFGKTRRIGSSSSPTSTTSALYAIGVLAKKAKEADLRKSISDGMIEDSVKETYKQMKSDMENIDLTTVSNEMGPLQQAITKRVGTISVIAEYKRKNSFCKDGMIHSLFDPELLSPQYREYGASAISVLADERMGGCSYDDIKAFVEEQRRAQNEVPGPVPIINNDLIIDEIQIAQTATYGASACVLNFAVVGTEQLPSLLKACKAVQIESIVAVATQTEAQQAIDLGAQILLVIGGETRDEKVSILNDLQIPEGRTITTIATIQMRPDKGLQEIEDAWALRDTKKINAVWVSDALYKAGSDAVESPGNIIKSMKSKSSLKWASPKAYSGKGEGAREYLGDIMM